MNSNNSNMKHLIKHGYTSPFAVRVFTAALQVSSEVHKELINTTLRIVSPT